MARYVLLEVADNQEAEEVVKAVGVMGAIFVMGADGHFKNLDPKAVTVRGLFAKPTTFCECPNPGDKSNRGKKYGWWVHVSCGKPKKGHWQHPRNLLDPPDMSPKERSLYLGVAEPGLLQGGSAPNPKGVSQPPKPVEVAGVDYEALNLSPQTTPNKSAASGQCHNEECSRWYRAGTGYWYLGRTRSYAVCSRPCGKVLHDQGR